MMQATPRTPIQATVQALPRSAGPHQDVIPRRGHHVLDVARLFAGGRELTIHHAAADYRPRITRQNKLILTK